MNYYELLEISPSASVEVIKNAYKRLAKRYHPDTYEGDRSFAEEKMKLLNEAVSVLEVESQRREYDIINGIYHGSYISNMPDMPDEYYTDMESRLNIHVDENGEPVFFSSDSEDSYMDTIDDFINNKKPKRKSKNPKKTKYSGKSDDISFDDIDIDIGISDISEMSKAADMNNFDDRIDYNSNIDSEYNTSSKHFKTFDFFSLFNRNKRGAKKSGSKIPQWYYITLISIIAANIIIVFLILCTVDLGNIANIISGFWGKTEDVGSNIDDTDEYNAEHFTGGEFIITSGYDETIQTWTAAPTIENNNIYIDLPPDNTTVTDPPTTADTPQNAVTIQPTTKKTVSPPVTQKPVPTAPPQTTSAATATDITENTEVTVPAEIITESTEESTTESLLETSEYDTTEPGTNLADSTSTNETVEITTSVVEETTTPTADTTVPVDTTINIPTTAEQISPPDDTVNEES